MLPVTYVDILIVIIFLASALITGIYTGNKIKTIKEYISYYKNYSPAILGLSLIMVIFGSGTISGTVTEIHNVGLIYAVASFGYVINSIITAKYIIPKIDKKYEGMLSVCDIFKYFYGKQAENLAAIIAFIFDIGAAGSQLVALGKIISYFFGINYQLGLLITGGILITYSTLGGVRTVTYMDIVKCVLLLIFIPVLASIVTFKVGGFISILENASPERLLIFDHPEFLKYCVLFIFFTFPVHMLQPIVVQRLLMINDPIISSRALYIYGLLRTALIWMMASIALSSLIFLPNVNAKEALYVTILSMIPPVLKGFVIITLIAIVMFKADAHLNSSGIIAANNFLPRSLNKYLSELTIIRSSTLLIGILALLLAVMDLSIVNLIVFIELLWSISIGWPLLAAILGLNVTPRLLWVYLMLILPALVLLFILGISYYTPLLALIIAIFTFSTIYYIQLTTKVTLDLKKQKGFLFYLKVIYETLKTYIPTFSKVSQYSTRKVEGIGADYFVFGIFFCVNYTIPHFMWNYSQPYISDIAISLRVIAGLLCLGLLLKNFWPASFKIYFSLYWHFTLMVTLPLMTFLMLLLQDWSVIWLVNMALSIFLLVLLTDWLSFTIITIIGVLSAALIYKVLIGNISFPTDISTSYLAVYTFLFSILIGLIFARRKEEALNERIEIAKLLSGTIAHEMRTFLLTIRNYSNGLKEHLPLLIQEYGIASSHKLINSRLPSEQFNALGNLAFNIEKVLKKAFSFIDLLLINIKGPTLTQASNLFSINECIEEAMQEYPMTSSEKKYFVYDFNQNFFFFGNKDIIIHIMYNLISNSLYFISNTQNPRIEIWKSYSENYNLLHFKDNGPGINTEEIPLIFNKFYSNAKKGTGLGLYFCKISMKMFSGDILCTSVKGEYTEFILKFPK